MVSGIKAYSYAGLTVLLWSTVSTAFKMSLQVMAPVYVLAISSLVASATCLGVIIIRKQLHEVFELHIKDVGILSLLGVVLFLYYISLFMAYEKLPAQVAQPINCSWGIVLAIFLVVFGDQKISFTELCFMIMAYAGVVIIIIGSKHGGGSFSIIGLALIVGSTLIYAILWLLLSKINICIETKLLLIFVAAFATSVLGIVFFKIPMRFSLHEAVPAIYIGLFEMSVSYILWGKALKYAPSVSCISALSLLVPFLSFVWIQIVLKEKITSATLLGTMLIVLGTLLQQYSARTKTQN